MYFIKIKATKLNKWKKSIFDEISIFFVIKSELAYFKIKLIKNFQKLIELEFLKISFFTMYFIKINATKLNKWKISKFYEISIFFVIKAELAYFKIKYSKNIKKLIELEFS